MLGGDSRQEEPGTHLLARLARGRANLDRTFEALDGLVRERTGWPDITGERAALQSLLTSSRRRIESLASREPEQAARQLAALFKLFELRAGGSDQGRLAAARGILARSGAARPAAELNETPARPANAAAPAPAPVRAPSPEVVAARQATQAIGRLRDAIRASNAVPSAAAHKDLTAARDRASRLYQRDGPLWSSATVRQYRDFLTQANAALDRPLPSAQGATVVEALGKAIRAYDAAPGSSAREGLNDALALARSLNRKQGVHWTPATRENFDALARQAQARLYPHSTAPSRPASPPLPGEQAAAVPQPPQPLHLPAPGARVEHTGGDVRTPAQIEEEHLARVAQRLEEARNAYYERRKTQLAGGDETALVARIYEEMGLRSLGVSQEQFQNHLKAEGQPSGENAARVTAGDSGAGARGSGGPQLPRIVRPAAAPDPEQADDPLAWQRSFLGRAVVNFLTTHWHAIDRTPDSRRVLAQILSRQDGHIPFSLPFIDASGQEIAADVTLTRRKTEPQRVFVEARLGKEHVRFTAKIEEGGLVVPGHEPAQLLRIGADEGWRLNGFPNTAGTHALPAGFWDPATTKEALRAEINADASAMDRSWNLTREQKELVLNLFEHRDLIKRLIEQPFDSLDEARSSLIHALRKMDSMKSNMLPAETGWYLYPRGNAEGQWGISPPLIGSEGGVDDFSLGINTERHGSTGGSQQEPGEFLHTHPSEPWQQRSVLFGRAGARRFRAGFSIGDVLSTLEGSGNLLVYHEGAVFRLSVKSEWFDRSAQSRAAVTDGLTRWLKNWLKKETQSTPAEMNALNRMLQSLPLVLEQVGPLPQNHRMDARPIADAWPARLGPEASEVPRLPLLSPPPGLLDGKH